MRAAVTYLYAKRLEAIGRLMAESSPGSAQLWLWAMNIWNYVKHPWYIAFLELRAAARTDQHLAATLYPAEQEFEDALCQLTVDVCKEGQRDAESFYAALDLSRYAIEGMAIRLLAHDESAREHQMLGYLEGKLRNFQPDPAAPA